MIRLNHKFAVAPMMDWTDRHCRVLHRLLSKRARLYTEMVTADAILRGDRERLIGFSEIEHPVALQLGGADPQKLAQAARIGAEFGYDEINLNIGCPSDRVQSGCFGAALMREPVLVAECAAAMRAAVKIPVTVKCRIGVDDQYPQNALPELVDSCARAGVTIFAVHARKAWLSGLSPKENREVPPLDYPLVYALKRARPLLTILINGGIASLDEAEEHLGHVDGVMMGRAAYQSPGLLADVDRRFFGEAVGDVAAAVSAYVEYVAAQLDQGVPLNAMTKHMLGLFHGQSGARLFRRHLSENATRKGAGLAVLRDALGYVRPRPHRFAALSTSPARAGEESAA
jgi:tRNA-dihydrouridine synthase A